MTLRAEIIGRDPGQAQLRLHGITPEAGSLRLQIRRNQGPDTYLGGNGRWQSTPDFWFTIADRTPSADGIDFAIGPEIVDPIAASLAGNAFQITIETPAGAMSASLVIPQHPVLLASGAAGAPQRPAPEPPTAPPPPPPPAPTPSTLKADPIARHIEKPSGSRFGLIVIAIILILALAVGGYFLRERVTALLDDTVGTEQPPPPESSELEQIKTFLTQNPDAAPRLAKAREMLAACKLNWASVLYRDLGQAGDAEAALAMGRFYDPADPVCPEIKAPNRSLSSDTAEFWYRKAIAAKSVEAQRRLGAMLVAAGKDAPKYQEGIDLLKQASGQGDADAAAKLKELGQ